MFGNLGAGEIVILLLIVLLVFGANRLPDAGRAVGKGLREFRRALSDAEDSIRNLPDDDARREKSGGLGRAERDARPKRLIE